MADKASKILNLNHDAAPPSGGTGETTVPFSDDGQQVVLKWKDGAVVDVVPSSLKNPGTISTYRMRILQTEEEGGAGAGIVTCYKCAKDSTTGREVCWDVPC
jgi:hypothetical protein